MGAAKASNQELLDTVVKRKTKRCHNTNKPLSGTQWDPDPGPVSFWCHEPADPDGCRLAATKKAAHHEERERAGRRMASAQHAEWGRSTSRGLRGGKYRWRNLWSKRELGPKGARGPKGGRARAKNIPWDDNRPVPRRENGRGRMVQRPEACERVSPVSRHTMPRGQGRSQTEKDPH